MKLPKDRVDLRKEIAQMDPYKAKKAIRNREKYLWRADWNDDEAQRVMMYILKIKFAPLTTWAEKLRKTGNEEIVEINNWHDNRFGNCICDKCKDIPGQNWLGKILMKIRSEYD